MKKKVVKKRKKVIINKTFIRKFNARAIKQAVNKGIHAKFDRNYFSFIKRKFVKSLRKKKIVKLSFFLKKFIARFRHVFVYKKHKLKTRIWFSSAAVMQLYPNFVFFIIQQKLWFIFSAVKKKLPVVNSVNFFLF